MTNFWREQIKEKKKMNLFEFVNVIFSLETTIEWLKARKLLKSIHTCEDCKIPCSWTKDSAKNDKYFWRRSQCKKKYSIRRGSFFEGSHLSLQVLLTIVYLFSLKIPLYICEKLLSGLVSHRVLIDWFNFCRDVMAMNIRRNPIKLGGPGKIVEIDESKFGKKRKYNRGRMPNPGFWVFGAVERDSNNFELWVVDRRDRESLQPLIQETILPGTMIYSDDYSVYRNLDQIGYGHEIVNHSVEFVNENEAHTNTMEGFWGVWKAAFKQMRGCCNIEMCRLHLYKIMYRGRYPGDIFTSLLKDISFFYNV